MIEVGTDFSGVGAFDQALIRLGVDYKTVFACDNDKYARQTYITNYGAPDYFPEDVYDRAYKFMLPLDIYMTSPPCQGFSLAGLRKGSILFLNSHEFIKVNKPRYFIFENVKGLLSHDKRDKKAKYGNTFNEWINYLGGKSVNGNTTIFPHENSVPYHIYHKVLNAKHYGVPQNRERIFIIGIRDDVDNNFSWPKPFHLTKKLKDVLESDVDKKYYLSDKMLNYLFTRKDNFNNGKINFKSEDDVASCLNRSSSSLDISYNIIKCVGNTHPSGHGMNGNVYSEEGISPSLTTNKGEGIKIKSATKKGYETAKEGDSINFSVLNSKTRRGRVGKEVSQTLDTACNQGVITTKNYIQWDASVKGYKSQQDRAYYENGNMGTIPASRTENKVNVLLNNYKIRRLTPRECFRLMDFPDSFKMPCSDTQMYKQAGNSIVVAVLEKIISKLNL